MHYITASVFCGLIHYLMFSWDAHYFCSYFLFHFLSCLHFLIDFFLQHSLGFFYLLFFSDLAFCPVLLEQHGLVGWICFSSIPALNKSCGWSLLVKPCRYQFWLEIVPGLLFKWTCLVHSTVLSEQLWIWNLHTVLDSILWELIERLRFWRVLYPPAVLPTPTTVLPAMAREC